MKKIVLLVSVLLLSACGNDKDVTEESSSVTSESSSEVSQTMTTETSTEMTESNSQTTETTETTDSEEYPYAVDLTALGLVDEQGNQVDTLSNELAFYVEGMNTPKQIVIGNAEDAALGLCVNIHWSADETTDGDVSYPIIIENVPTQEITVFGGPGAKEEKRTVQVNTQLTLSAYDGFEEDTGQDPQLDGQQYYLFVNDQGKLSLATNNFAGNVGEEDADTMQEYVEE